MISYGQAIKIICRYFLGNREQGLVMLPDILSGIDWFVHAGFAGNWHKENVETKK